MAFENNRMVLWLFVAFIFDKTNGDYITSSITTIDNADITRDGLTSPLDITTAASHTTVPSVHQTTSVERKHANLTLIVSSLTTNNGHQITESPPSLTSTSISRTSAGLMTRTSQTSSKSLSTRTTTTTEAPQTTKRASSTTSRTTTTTTAYFPGEGTITTTTNTDDIVTTDVAFSTVQSGSTSSAPSSSTSFAIPHVSESKSSSNGAIIAVAVIVPVVVVVCIAVAVWYFKFRYRKGGTSFTDLQMT